MAETPPMEPWLRRPGYKYGMLVLIALLLLWHLWTLLLEGPGTVGGAKLGLVVVAMLLVNHFSAAFLNSSQQRRIRPLQWAVLLGGLAYAAVALWRNVRGG